MKIFSWMYRDLSPCFLLYWTVQTVVCDTHSFAANSDLAWCGEILLCQHTQWSDVRKWSGTSGKWENSTPLQHPAHIKTHKFLSQRIGSVLCWIKFFSDSSILLFSDYLQTKCEKVDFSGKVSVNFQFLQPENCGDTFYTICKNIF